MTFFDRNAIRIGELQGEVIELKAERDRLTAELLSVRSKIVLLREVANQVLGQLPGEEHEFWRWSGVREAVATLRTVLKGVK